MSRMERRRLWFRTLWSTVEAAEVGPVGYMDRQISSLSDRVKKLENDRPNGIGWAADIGLGPNQDRPD